MRGIHRWPVDSPHNGPITRKKFPFDDVIIVFIFLFSSGQTNCDVSVSRNDAKCKYTLVVCDGLLAVPGKLDSESVRQTITDIWCVIGYPNWQKRPQVKHHASTFTLVQFSSDSRFSLSQWETALHCNDVSHWLGASLKSALQLHWHWQT